LADRFRAVWAYHHPVFDRFVFLIGFTRFIVAKNPQHHFVVDFFCAAVTFGWRIGQNRCIRFTLSPSTEQGNGHEQSIKNARLDGANAGKFVSGISATDPESPGLFGGIAKKFTKKADTLHRRPPE
jgi:hypothetical protein